MMKAIKGFFGEFQTFASRGNFLDLAVGIVIGTSFTAVTTALVTNILTPPLGLLIGRVNFTDLKIPIGGSASIQYGLFFQAIIQFIITAFALFILIRSINHLEDIAKRKQNENDPPAAPPEPTDPPDVALLKEIRDVLKQQQPQHHNLARESSESPPVTPPANSS